MSCFSILLRNSNSVGDNVVVIMLVGVSLCTTIVILVFGNIQGLGLSKSRSLENISHLLN